MAVTSLQQILLLIVMLVFLYIFGLYLFAHLMFSDRQRNGFVRMLEILTCSGLLLLYIFLPYLYTMGFIIILTLVFGIYYFHYLKKRSNQKRDMYESIDLEKVQ
ncbi:hypothetical protein D3C76_928670 [compost metagenome]